MDDLVFDIETSGSTMTVDGTPVQADWVGPSSMKVGDRVIDVRGATADGELWQLSLDGSPMRAEVLDERSVLARKADPSGGRAGGPRAVKAPMPGLVVRVEVEVGQAVEVGQSVAIVEAMKMENELRAEQAGVVSRIHAAAGDTVVKDALLIEFEAPEEPETP